MGGTPIESATGIFDTFIALSDTMRYAKLNLFHQGVITISRKNNIETLNDNWKLHSITTNYLKTGVNGVVNWIFEWVIVNKF